MRPRVFEPCTLCWLLVLGACDSGTRPMPTEPVVERPGIDGPAPLTPDANAAGGASGATAAPGATPPEAVSAEDIGGIGGIAGGAGLGSESGPAAPGSLEPVPQELEL